MNLESVLFKKVTIVFPDKTLQGDVFVKDGKIQAIGPSLSVSAELEMNEPHLTLMAGVIDPHVHLRDPGATHKEDLHTGSKACAAGGVTSFFDMPNTKPSTTTIERMADKKKIAAEKSLVNYNFFIGATADNLEECLAVPNVPGIKIYVGSSTGTLLVDEQDPLERLFSTGQRLIAVHSEDETILKKNYSDKQGTADVHDHYKIRSVEAALTCTKRLVALSIKHKRRLHICHLTSKDELDFLIPIMAAYPFITTEVTPQHLFTYAPDIYNDHGTYAQINPPIRERLHAEALQKGLLEGHIGCIGTDHAPHTKEEKDKPFGQAPSGMPGLDTSLPMMLHKVNQHWCTLPQVTQWMSKCAADYYKIKNKGLIQEGYDADLVLVDMRAKRRVDGHKQYTKCQWSIFEGQVLQGWPIATFVNGQLAFREGDFFETCRGKEVQFNH